MHPGPRHSDGSYVGRSAPEIDVFEQQVGLVQKNKGEVSQSLQLAVGASYSRVDYVRLTVIQTAFQCQV
jgi:hypothetical protein